MWLALAHIQRATVGVTSNGLGERERWGWGRYDKQVVLGLGKCLVIVMLSLFMRFGTLPGCQAANRRPQTTNGCALQRSDNHHNIDDNNNKNNRNNNNANDNRKQAGAVNVVAAIKVINFVTQAAILAWEGLEILFR